MTESGRGTMKTKWIAIAMVLALVACGPSAEQRAALQKALPPGCEVHDVGAYGEIEDLIFVACDGRKAVTALWMESHSAGKKRVYREYASISFAP